MGALAGSKNKTRPVVMGSELACSPVVAAPEAFGAFPGNRWVGLCGLCRKKGRPTSRAPQPCKVPATSAGRMPNCFVCIV